MFLIVWTPNAQSTDYRRDSELLTDADQIGPRITTLEQQHPGQHFTAVTGEYLPWARSLPLAT